MFALDLYSMYYLVSCTVSQRAALKCDALKYLLRCPVWMYNLSGKCFIIRSSHFQFDLSLYLKQFDLGLVSL